MVTYDPKENRRGYPRIQAPVYCRPAPLLAPVASVDIGLGGVRVYSDEQFEVGSRMEIELFLREEPSLIFTVQVVWINPLPGGAPARYDVGLQFLDVPQQGLHRLRDALEP